MTRNRREDLLKAACTAIAESGVRGLRVEDVAARAGVAVSLVYYHFGSRAGLLGAVMDYSNARAPMAFPPVGRRGSAYEELEAALLADTDDTQIARENCIVWNELTASAVFDEQLRRRVDDVLLEWTQTTAAFIQAGQKDGSIRADVDPREEAELVTSIHDGLISRWIAGSLSRETIRELLCTVLRNRLKPVSADGGRRSAALQDGEAARTSSESRRGR